MHSDFDKAVAEMSETLKDVAQKYKLERIDELHILTIMAATLTSHVKNEIDRNKNNN